MSQFAPKCPGFRDLHTGTFRIMLLKHTRGLSQWEHRPSRGESVWIDRLYVNRPLAAFSCAGGKMLR
jgi:hypothetical protein